MVKYSTTAEKRLIIDIRATREAYENRDITNIGWIPLNQNIAGGLNKVTDGDALDDELRIGVLNIKIKQWIERAMSSTCDEMLTPSREPTFLQRKYPSDNIDENKKKEMTL